MKKDNREIPDFSQLYDPEAFRKKGYALIDQLSDYLSQSIELQRPVIAYTEPDIEYAYWEKYNINGLSDFQYALIKRSISLHHPQYIGHQVAVPLPELALLGLTSDLLNNGMGIYEMGAAATAMERWVINELSRYAGYQSENNGFLTSGGTLANLTALLAARVKAQTQYPQQKDWVVLVSDQAHFCVERAVITMGLTMSGICKIKSDDHFRMDPKDLNDQFEKAKAEGKRILAVVGCACSTATGSYDDIEALSVFCKSHDLWLHIDGAHGGAVIFSEKYKSLVNGISQANSIVIDTHKMMLTPALSTAVLFRDADDSYNSFKQKADYLFNKEERDPHNLAKRTYETTKYMMCIKVYYLLKMYGAGLIESFIDRQYDLARDVYQKISTLPYLEAAHQPMSNILCFRFKDEQIADDLLDDINRKIRSSLLESGQFYIVSTVLNGHYYLRMTFMNPLTSLSHVNKLFESIQTLGHKFLSQHQTA